MELPISINQIVEQKLKPQIEAQGMTPEQAEQYVQEYMDQAGEDFTQAINSQVEQVKAQFQSIVQKITTLSTSLIAIPTILANPMTIAVANQTLQEVLGNIKSVMQDINSLSGKVSQMVGSVPGAFDTLNQQAVSVGESAKSSIVLASVKVGDQEERSLTDPDEVISYNITYLTDLTQIIWTGVEPATSIELEPEEAIPRGISQSTSGLSLTLAINPQLVNNNTSWSYIIKVTYQEEDGMDDSGNIQYKDSIQEYQGKITK